MFSLTADFTANIVDVHKEKGTIWLRDLAKLLHTIEQRWDIKIESPFNNLTYSFVASVQTKTGTAVLKVAPKCQRTEREIAWYEAQIKNCTPRLLRGDKQLGALLLEKLEPGISLKEMVLAARDDEATEAIVLMILSLKQPAPSRTELFPHVHELDKDLSLLKGKIPTTLYRTVGTIFHQLIANNSELNLLHGDLHHGNILSHKNTFKAIDPHGYIGPQAFEVGAMIRNPYDAFPKDRSLENTLRRRLDIFNQLLPFSYEEICGWALCYTLIASAWSLSDHGEIPAAHLAIADILARL